VLPFADFILDTTFTLFRRVTSIELLVAAVSCAAAAGCIGADIRTRVALVAAVIVVISGAGCWVVRKDSLH